MRKWTGLLIGLLLTTGIAFATDPLAPYVKKSGDYMTGNLTVWGKITGQVTIESQAGGIKFPDGTIQTSAATVSNSALSTFETTASLLARDYATNTRVNSYETTSSLIARGYATTAQVNTAVGTLEPTATLATKLGTYELTANVIAKIGTFETTTQLLSRGYIGNTAVDVKLGTFEPTANVITKLGTFDTIAARNTALGSYSTTTGMNTAIGVAVGTLEPTATLLSRGYITATALTPYATLSGLSTYETTSSVITRLGTFDTISARNNALLSYATQSAIGSLETQSHFNTDIATRETISGATARIATALLTLETSSHASTTYVPYTGATTGLNLGNNSFTTVGSASFVNFTASGITTFGATSIPIFGNGINFQDGSSQTTAAVTSAAITSLLNTFETTSSLISRGYITGSPLGTFETISDHNISLSTFETSSSVITRLGTFDTISARTTAMNNANAIVKEPTGFTTPEGVNIVYNLTDRTILLTGEVQAYWRGNIVPSIVSGYLSPTHDATVGAWYLSYDGSTVSWSQSPWTFDKLQIAYVNYGSIDKFAFRETHGFMQWQTHKELHNTIGTFRTGGGQIGGITNGSTTVALRRPTITATTINDEDLQSINSSSTDLRYTQMSIGSGISVITKEALDIIPLNGNIPYYNQLTGGNWIQTPMTAATYTSVWLIAIPTTYSQPSQKYRYIFIQGQSLTNLAGQQALTPADVNLSSFAVASPEFVFITKFIINYVGGGTANWNIQSVTDLTGNKFIQTATPSGTFLNSVSTDTTLTGDGTIANLLGVNQTLYNQITADAVQDNASIATALSTFETIAAHNSTTKEVYIQVISPTTALTTGTGEAFFTFTEGLLGKTLKSIKTHVYTASTSGTPEFQAVNYSRGNANLLSTTSKIDVGTFDSAFSVTPEVVTAGLTFVTGDAIGINCIGAGTGTKGFDIRLKFQ